MEYYSFILLFIAGIAAGFINVFAGGGTTLTLPLLIFFGLDGTVANGTNRIAILVQNIFAVYSFRKEKYSRFKVSLKLALFTLPGAIIGAVIATNISGELFEKILAIVMIGIMITMMIPQKHKSYDRNDNSIPVKVYIAMFVIGFYGGFMQVGVGLLLMAALHHLLKENLVYVNVHKVFIIFLYSIPTILVFIISNNVDWLFGLCLAAGHATGAWWAAKLNVRKGEKFIKYVMIVAMLIISLKLLDVF